MESHKKGVVRFLVWTFAIAWSLQLVAVWCFHHSAQVIVQLLLIVVMYAPFLGTFLSGAPLKEMGWKPKLKGKLKYVLVAWFVPGLLTVAGAVLYFVVFPEHFDLSGAYLTENMGEGILEQLEAQGLTYPLYILAAVISSFTYAPLLNMLAAVGEEVGWRGVFYPHLKQRFGAGKGCLLGGTIWGIWHWPLIALIGYEYGTAYWGFPVLGMFVFCIFTITMGILCDFLYEKTACIWIPAIAHGAVNAAGTVPIAVCDPDHADYMLLGPSPNGLLAGLPFVLIAAVILWRRKNGICRDI